MGATIYEFPAKRQDNKGYFATLLDSHLQNHSDEFRRRVIDELSPLLSEKLPTDGAPVSIRLQGQITPEQLRLNEIELARVVGELRAEYLELLAEVVRLKLLIIEHECSSKGCKL